MTKSSKHPIRKCALYLPHFHPKGVCFLGTCPLIRASLPFCILAQHVLCLVDNILHLLNENLFLSLQYEFIFYLEAYKYVNTESSGVTIECHNYKA